MHEAIHEGDDAIYPYNHAKPDHSHGYLLPCIEEELDKISGEKRLFDLGCGNGSVGAALSQKGWDVTGVDISREGIEKANAAYPHLKLNKGSVYDDLAATYGTFPVVISLEVIEHLYDPRAYVRTLKSLLRPRGTAIISTPYHGYWKNLVLALTGKMESHFTTLWDHGHIKFFSIATLTQVLEDAGLEVMRFHRVGRVPVLAKSMVAVARLPEG